MGEQSGFSNRLLSVLRKRIVVISDLRLTIRKSLGYNSPHRFAEKLLTSKKALFHEPMFTTEDRYVEDPALTGGSVLFNACWQMDFWTHAMDSRTWGLGHSATA